MSITYYTEQEIQDYRNINDTLYEILYTIGAVNNIISQDYRRNECTNGKISEKCLHIFQIYYLNCIIIYL